MLLFFNILHPNTTFLCSFVVLTDIFYYICKQLGLEVYGVRGLWGLLDYFLLYGMMQSKKNPWNAGNLFSLLIVCASINISEIISQIYLAQNLHQRSIRYFKKVCLLLCRNTAHALCDIRRNRSNSPTQLITQCILLLLRKCPQHLIHASYKSSSINISVKLLKRKNFSFLHKPINQ